MSAGDVGRDHVDSPGSGRGAGRRAGRNPAPWVRTRLRTSRAAAALMTVLVLGTSFLATALPRTLDRDADREVTRLLAALPGAERGVSATVLDTDHTSDGGSATAMFSPSSVSATASKIQRQLIAPLAPNPQNASFGAHSIKGRPLTDPGLSRVDEVDPQLNLFGIVGQLSHVTVVQGRAPLPTEGLPGIGGQSYEVMMSKTTADQLGVRLGAFLTAPGAPGVLHESRAPSTAKLQVVGLFQPNDPNDPFWNSAPCVVSACIASTPDKPPLQYWNASAFINEQLMSVLPDYAHSELFWNIPVDAHHLHAAQVPAAQQLVSSILNGQRAATLRDQVGVPSMGIDSQLPGVFTQALQEQAAAAPIYAIGPVGAGSVALVLLALAAGLAVDRRQSELLLLRARGGSLRGIGGRLLAETAVPVLPAAVLGTALALVLLPSPRWGAAVLLGAATGLASLLPFPIRALLMLRDHGPRGGRNRRPERTAGRRRASIVRALGEPRRLVAELGVLTLAVGAVVAVRRRGVTPPGSSLDLLLSSAPLLLALAGAVLLARIFPLLLSPAALLARRGRGALGFLGLARATRAGGVGGGQGAGGDRGAGGRAPSVLPLLALVLAVTTAGFGVTVLDSATRQRQVAVRQMLGADARVTGNDETTLPPGFLAAVAKLPGVHGGTAMFLDRDASLGGQVSGSMMLIVDPASYAALAGRVGYGQIDPTLLEQPTATPDAAVPAIVTDQIADRLGTGDQAVSLPAAYGELRYHVVGTTHGSLALPAGGPRPVLIVSSAAVARQLPSAKYLVDNPNAWFGTGDGISSTALRALLSGELTADQHGSADVTASAGAGAGAGAGADQGASGAGADQGASGAGADQGASGGAASPGASASASPGAGASASPGAGAGPAGGTPSSGSSTSSTAGTLSVDDFFSVATSDDLSAGISGHPLQHSAEQLFWTAVVTAAGYSLLSLLLTLLRAAPERAALLARLRAMGLRPRQGVALILCEALPQALTAAAAGAGIACLSAPLLGSTVNLSAMVGAAVPGGLRTDTAAVCWLAAALAGLCTLLILVETALTGRRQINTELRAGDQR
ncbi:hypothetical protein LN042_04260 [Kitasatospora sp. RB6PN24]|uniref:FtsX-like permease family protein n=1 Tax=Kitasatospora humi TaxID=2893891 RepID=UPI001E38A437|nr:FtsX-like permease family protein [Kitasatospora humi]MCC9306329.1 hypothetical protein [Kitasatospora humi]